jgi:hypothetical protein
MARTRLVITSGSSGPVCRMPANGVFAMYVPRGPLPGYGPPEAPNLDSTHQYETH